MPSSAISGEACTAQALPVPPSGGSPFGRHGLSKKVFSPPHRKKRQTAQSLNLRKDFRHATAGVKGFASDCAAFDVRRFFRRKAIKGVFRPLCIFHLPDSRAFAQPS